MHNQTEDELVTAIITQLTGKNAKTVAQTLLNQPLMTVHKVMHGFEDNGVWSMFASDTRNVLTVLEFYRLANTSSERMALAALLTAIVAQTSIVEALYNKPSALVRLIEYFNHSMLEKNSHYDRCIETLYNTILRSDEPFFKNCSEIMYVINVIETNETREKFIKRLSRSGHLEKCRFDFENLDSGFFPNDTFETLLDGFKRAQDDVITEDLIDLARHYDATLRFTAEIPGVPNPTNERLTLFSAYRMIDIQKNPRSRVQSDVSIEVEYMRLPFNSTGIYDSDEDLSPKPKF